MSDDEELMVEISHLAEEAEMNKPRTANGLAMATTLAARFDHRSVDEIRKQINTHWRAKGLFLGD